MFAKETLTNRLTLDLIKPFLPDYTPKNINIIKEVFEPSSNTYDYFSDDGLNYYFTTSAGDKYLVTIDPVSDNRIYVDFGLYDKENDFLTPETNKYDVYKITATLSNLIKTYLEAHPNIEIISWSSVAKTGDRKIGDTQRDKIYKSIFKKQGNLKDEDIVFKNEEWWAYLKGYDPLFESMGLLTPQDFFTPLQDEPLNLNISSEPTRVDYYKDHIKNVVPSDFKVEKHKNKIVVSNIHKDGLEHNKEFTSKLISLTLHMIDNHPNIEPLPDITFIEDDKENANNILGRTAHYDPNAKCITLYTYGRHPKDILRSYAHEMIHHMQNLENRIHDIQGQNINEDEYLRELEEEAYSKGNMCFRGWENHLKSN
jgi:hypothetical protein